MNRHVRKMPHQILIFFVLVNQVSNQPDQITLEAVRRMRPIFKIDLGDFHNWKTRKQSKLPVDTLTCKGILCHYLGPMHFRSLFYLIGESFSEGKRCRSGGFYPFANSSDVGCLRRSKRCKGMWSTCWFLWHQNYPALTSILQWSVVFWTFLWMLMPKMWPLHGLGFRRALRSRQEICFLNPSRK